jgi:hypothetical protein
MYNYDIAHLLFRLLIRPNLELFDLVKLRIPTRLQKC